MKNWFPVKSSRKGEKMKWHLLVLITISRESAIFVEKLVIRLLIARTERRRTRKSITREEIKRPLFPSVIIVKKWNINALTVLSSRKIKKKELFCLGNRCGIC